MTDAAVETQSFPASFVAMSSWPCIAHFRLDPARVTSDWIDSHAAEIIDAIADIMDRQTLRLQRLRRIGRAEYPGRRVPETFRRLACPSTPYYFGLEFDPRATDSARIRDLANEILATLKRELASQREALARRDSVASIEGGLHHGA